MRSAGCLLSVALAIVPAVASGRRSAEVSDGAGARAWVRERVLRAQRGKRDLVRLPVASQSRGWGCICPPHYIGESPVTTPNTDWVGWLVLEFADGVSAPEQTDAGWVVLAEGEFTGQTSSVVYDQRYRLQTFRVLRWRFIGEFEQADLRVVEAAEAIPRVEGLTDGRPWLVVAASIDQATRGASARARDARDRLVRAGFTNAEVIDSHAGARLFCCYEVVVVGRFATRQEAETQGAAARRRGFRPMVRQAW